MRDIAKRLHLRTIRDERERNGLTCHLAAGLAVPVCQFGKHKACADETDHGQHLSILRSPSSAANGWQQITPTSRFSSAVRAEAVQPYRSGGKKENLSNYHEMEGDKRDQLPQATGVYSMMPWLVVRCTRCTRNFKEPPALAMTALPSMPAYTERMNEVWTAMAVRQRKGFWRCSLGRSRQVFQQKQGCG